MKQKLLALVVLTLAIVPLIPTAAAAWTTSDTHPASFRPGRAVSFTYSTSSSNTLDPPWNYDLTLYTCPGSTPPCGPGGTGTLNWGVKTLTAGGNSANSVTWSVTLNTAEGPYAYNYAVACNAQSVPCTPATYTRQGTFPLAYTHTYTHSITTPMTPVTNTTTATVAYQLRSTSVDDQPFTAAVELFSTPAGATTQRSEGQKSITSVPASTATVIWTPLFQPYGSQSERVHNAFADLTGTDTQLAVAVQDCHIHTAETRASYTEGQPVGFLLTLECHGGTPNPAPIAATTISATYRNATVQVGTATTTTDANGRAYLVFQPSVDLTRLDYTFTAAPAFNGNAYTPGATGTSTFKGPYDARQGERNITTALSSAAANATTTGNLTRLQSGLNNITFNGVHLDDLGTRNMLLIAARGAGALVLLVGMIALIIIVAVRI